MFLDKATTLSLQDQPKPRFYGGPVDFQELIRVEKERELKSKFDGHQLSKMPEALSDIKNVPNEVPVPADQVDVKRDDTEIVELIVNVFRIRVNCSNLIHVDRKCRNGTIPSSREH
jgi:hypothetical protein